MSLYLTYCSAKKRKGIHTPDNLYISDRISKFINRCTVLDVDWAIFSALYGLFFPREKKKDYNVTFRTDARYWLRIAVIKDNAKLSPMESKTHISQLVKKLRSQFKKHTLDQIVFYGPSPKMMRCYLGVLHYAFNNCSKSHGWQDLVEHVAKKDEKLEVIHKLTLIPLRGR